MQTFKKIIPQSLKTKIISSLKQSNMLWLKKQELQKKDDSIFSYYEKVNGVKIPCYRNYRYSLKLGWKYIDSLRVMSELRDQKKVLSSSDNDFFESCIGEYTILRPIQEIDHYFNSIRKNYNQWLLNGLDFDKRPNTIPTEKEINKKIQYFLRKYKEIFSKLRKNSVYNFQHGDSILEIGYTSGGYSIFALEKMGFEAMGIDNFYSGIAGETSVHGYIRDTVKSQANFLYGDITKRTDIESGSLDVINSISVLEHIMNLPSAMEEFFKLLKPGGIMIHSYDTFFHPRGGHALGILDSPWCHTRLNEQEYLEYLNRFRPYEAELAMEWFLKGIHRDYPIHKMQRLIMEKGFEITYWYTQKIPDSKIKNLTPDIVRDSFKNYPDISLDDLLSSEHLFVARKPYV